MAQLFRRDDEGCFCLPATNVLHGCFEGKQEAGAGSGYIESGCVDGADIGLYIAGGGGGKGVRCDGGYDEEVNLLRGDAGGFDGSLGCGSGHIAGLLAGCGNAALLDAGASHNPFVGGVHHFLQILVSEAAFRHIGACADECHRKTFERFGQIVHNRE